MNITITFRHMEGTEAVKKHAHEKLAKLQKFLRTAMTRTSCPAVSHGHSPTPEPAGHAVWKPRIVQIPKLTLGGRFPSPLRRAQAIHQAVRDVGQARR